MLKSSHALLGRWLHWAFEASLLFKGLLAASEALGGLSLMFLPNAPIVRLVDWMTRNEITQEPSEKVAQWVQHGMAAFTIETQHFFAIYLCLHGGIKLAMVIGLARKIIWGYPAAMVILAGFVAYQLHHYTLSPSPVLLALSALDTLMIGLVWREYRLLLASRSPKAAASVRHT
ncbi:MAG: DUF2127 domain-containing protein [Paracoccaceae bacterium]